MIQSPRLTANSMRCCGRTYYVKAKAGFPKKAQTIVRAFPAPGFGSWIRWMEPASLSRESPNSASRLLWSIAAGPLPEAFAIPRPMKFF